MKGRIFIWVITLLFTMANWAWAGPVTHFVPNQAPKPAPVLSNQTTKPAPAGVQSQFTNPKPDLVIKSISFTKNIVHVGEDVGVVVKVTNKGHGVIGPTGKAITTKSGPTSLLIKIGRETNGQIFSIPSLITGQTRTVTRLFRIFSTTTIAIKAIIDPANTVAEFKENNNDMSKTLKIWPKPDLAIIDFGTIPQGNIIRMPGSFKVFAKIKNIGGLSPATNMQFDIEGDIPHDHDVTMHLIKPVPALRHNHFKMVYVTVTPVKAGTYTLGGKVDQNNQVVETNEQNNFPRLIQIQVKKGGADLDLVSVKRNYHRRHWRQNFVVTATVRNMGNLASGPFKIHLYRKHDYPAGSAQGSPIDMVKNCGSLGPNHSCNVSFTFKYKIYVGGVPVRVKIDPELKVNDYNRANNSKTIHLKVL